MGRSAIYERVLVVIEQLRGRPRLDFEGVEGATGDARGCVWLRRGGDRGVVIICWAFALAGSASAGGRGRDVVLETHVLCEGVGAGERFVAL